MHPGARVGRAATAAAATAATCLALAACGSAAGSPRLTWSGKPSFQGEGQLPGSIGPATPGPGRTPSSGPSGTTPTPSQTQPAQDPNVVAKQLSAPDAIAVLPDNTALVGERTTGRILRVQPQPGKPVQTVRTLGGLNAGGGGGLLDLALSPNYDQDNLVFALITTPVDTRVVDFTLTGPVTPVLTGIPVGPGDNRGRIAFGADERLYVGTGDGANPAAAADPASLSGKVLRVTDVGTPAPTNPAPTSPVYTRGHHYVAGLCLLPGTNRMLEVEPDERGRIEVNALAGGADYGWQGRGTGTQGPITTLPSAQTTPGGCAIIDSILYVTSLDGQDILSAPLTIKGGAISAGTFTPVVSKTYGRLETVVGAPDGALWITTSNKDGHGRPVADDERVLRIVPSGGNAKSPV
jgi:glucose/arabinose dehydrogenase